ncbi:hypothetical protein GCM10008018_45720 [Paenibacillus marchantiophytorum]|uniref:Type I restriction modification DNA specificity domain-containing protein n=1 Tax=Paenibacillus marchantiophytorum TaxID=1619310 RepID=A0ABQ1F0D5_9BACL|nr:restriction endonuclease subunit S [Paenibacillus marchantiophytorum]GFZ94139.1 hypothetical protein GCM10008018_45720 [Paenibacillus marchantiophytorum]
MVEDWQGVPLQEISTIGISTSLSRNLNIDKTQVVNYRTLSENNVISVENSKLEYSQPQKRYNLYSKGTILISLGKFSIGIGLLEIDAYAEQGICGIYINPDYALPEYIFYFLKWYRSKHNERWNQTLLGNILVPIPSKMEQKNIVDYMLKIDTIKRKREKLMSLASQYTLAQYGEIVEKGIRSQPVSTLGHLLDNIEVGQKIHRHQVNSGTLILKGKPNKYIHKHLIEIEQGEQGSLYPILAKPNDVLWYRYSNKQTIDPVIFHRWERPVAISNDWIRLTPSNKVSKEFLAKYLEENYHDTKSLFQYKNRRELIAVISQLPIKVPSIQDQQMFSSIAIMTNKIISDNRVALDKMNSLYQTYADEIFLSRTLFGRSQRR